MRKRNGVKARNGKYKLTEEEVKTIKASSEKNKHLAEKFRMDITTISRIRTGKRRKTALI